ncbi:TPA: hypothetical protein DCW38_02875 [candidate division WOR-3 bacterium]|jgi:hypothetical protein|uniref:Fibronectin type III domain-containing protein n=1 Tax=candidate division WOR-3 bacterium TaxID=2052148 RepID=A0A350H990_UNCW3|nr:hypothetical protein [candidate division WOR-3 bacterium]
MSLISCLIEDILTKKKNGVIIYLMRKKIFFALGIIFFISCSFLGRTPSDISVLLPADGALFQPANLQLVWYCENADKFQIYFGENQDSMDMISEQTGSTYEFTKLSPRTKYYWKIKAINNVGEKVTAVLSFTTGTIPDPVTNLLTPENMSMINEPNAWVSWEAVAYADSYFVEIAFDTMFLNLELSQMFDTTVCFHRDFIPLDTLYWRVQSWNTFGHAEWSPVHWFYVVRYLPK